MYLYLFLFNSTRQKGKSFPRVEADISGRAKLVPTNFVDDCNFSLTQYCTWDPVLEL